MVTATVARRRCPTNFGRRVANIPPQRTTFGDDVRLFATFFLGGLTFMSVYLA